jgi:quercetin dioxygenase-like cupin family protein
MNRKIVSASLAAALLGAALVVTNLAAEELGGITFIDMGALKWGKTPISEEMVATTVTGDGAKAGAIYTLRAKYPAGAKSAPHTHPDERVITVVSGSIFQGFGTTFDEKNGKMMKAGDVAIIPANTPHFGWAKEGEAVVQETGIGPTGTKPAGAPK